eukprot:CAMPEP_0174708698 /NCGR_PEP_ID=MMETSP1094-20130205/10879_1 /TAXON_ID=156173 /ORGANISM="Chrysochromulina brevifilum, Strain UTEX LB 985" /LENGTH=83 /DNA_ID=CAMNT_0015907289 /DNA_START=756 /DNA_END=1004 /DNA_ORIENTATION=+
MSSQAIVRSRGGTKLSPSASTHNMETSARRKHVRLMAAIEGTAAAEVTAEVAAEEEEEVAPEDTHDSDIEAPRTVQSINQSAS